jgi:hypothetical protein
MHFMVFSVGAACWKEISDNAISIVGSTACV